MNDQAHPMVLGDGFRAAAVEATSGQFCAVDSASVWSDLIEGRITIVDEFFVQGWLFLVVRGRNEPPERRLPPRSLEILEEILLGADPKVVSIDRGLSASTIANCLKQAYEAIGLRCTPSRVPLLLVTLVHAAKGGGPLDGGRAAEFEHCKIRYGALCVPSPDAVLDRFLSQAELAVMRMRLEGKSHAEIAARRRTSRRTVANQVATAFHRLGVSCRSDLMELLIASSRVLVGTRSHDAQAQTTPTQNPA